MPPPFAVALFPEAVEFRTLIVPAELAMPPPFPAVFPVNSMLLRVTVPVLEFSKPPPFPAPALPPATVRFETLTLPPVILRTRFPAPLIVIDWLVDPTIVASLLIASELPSVIVCDPAGRLKVIVPPGQRLRTAYRNVPAEPSSSVLLTTCGLVQLTLMVAWVLTPPRPPFVLFSDACT